MAKYYYEKWNSEKRYTNYKIPNETILNTKNIATDVTLGTWHSTSGIETGIQSPPSREFRKSYNYTYKKHPSGNFYDYAPSLTGGYVDIGEEGLSFLNYTGIERDAVYKVEYLSKEDAFSHTVSLKGWWFLNFDRIDIYEYFFKTTLQSVITAEDGTYPENGIHTDGYWYVRGSIVNQPPTTPPSLMVPENVRAGETLNIAWGASTDPDGDPITYRLERRVNGGTYSQIYSGASRSYSDTIQANWNTVQYRVRAHDGIIYSDYRTSTTIVVKTFPELALKIENQLKTSEAGWVKVDGQLKEIQGIWVKINGQLKEV